MIASMPQESPWEAEAERWVAWVRTTRDHVFETFASAFFDEIMPPPAGRTLEIGCGEGRVARKLVARSHDVVGVDGSPTLVRYARDADAASAYVVGDAIALPFADATFRTVVAYNSLQTLPSHAGMRQAIGEAARVLAPSGHLCICVAHPLTDAGLVRERGPSEDLVLSEYFERRRVDETVTKGELTMRFHGWTHTLEDYARALEDAGLIIDRIGEPTPTESQVAEHPSLARWRRIPLFLVLRALKLR